MIIGVAAASHAGHAQDNRSRTIRMRRHLDPEAVPRPYGRYRQVVSVPAAGRLAFVSGQLGVDRQGRVPDDVAEQARLAFAHIDACLAAIDMRREHVVRLSVYLTDLDHRAAYMAVRDAWVVDPPPASTLLVVKALALPACKLEIEAIAAA
jgi:enamine deaminase RidA (YjgF/YER057c/UK114 family)